MAKLTTKQRDKMPNKEFALPGDRFPINDANHAKAALSGASRAENVGNITAAEKATVVRKANAKLDGKIAAKMLAKKVGNGR